MKDMNAKKSVSALWNREGKRGFTLLELLIVIGIIAVLSVTLILVLNPAETLKKARDSQRMSDLNTLKTAIGLIITASTTPYLSGGNAVCFDGDSGAKIHYSLEGTSCTATAVTAGADANGTFTSTAGVCVASPTYTNVDGTGWVPVNFSWMPGGSPISNLPIDPVNTATSTITNSSLVYRYACQSTGTATKPSNVFELNATLESNAYTIDDNKMVKDGGDSVSYYEVGTNLKLLPTIGF